ncbi:MAG: hypothetical protein H6560_04605 [Lewinellaceae bacterium]|nr:hypothetical protein [Lewinellaceae bacterium]
MKNLKIIQPRRVEEKFRTYPEAVKSKINPFAKPDHGNGCWINGAMIFGTGFWHFPT